MATNESRLAVAGLSGDSGKTIASLSLVAGLRRRGFSVSVFKKGPDYIDPAWLSLAAGSSCRNLDAYMMGSEIVVRNFVRYGLGSDISIIEGNRGIYDGGDVSGTYSTAELTKLLNAPVVLVVSAAKSTRTIAAVVKGIADFDPEVNLAGVILNRIGGRRHVRVLSGAIEEYSGLPVLGTIPRLADDSMLIPARHLGLLPPAEYEGGAELHSKLCDIAEHCLDVDGMIEIARSVPPFSCAVPENPVGPSDRVRIGYFCDSVFTFYYPENLEALRARGGELVPVSSLADHRLPDVDGLYIGGGFPETQAEALSRNRSLMKAVKKAAVAGLPIYAECGGLIYLANSLHYNGRVYPMAGLYPIDLEMRAKPVGHGYMSVRVDEPNPFYPTGLLMRGHEFHYSGPVKGDVPVRSCFNVEAGVGVCDGRDGLVCAYTLACYMHIHSDGVEGWASGMITRAAQYAAEHRRPGADNVTTKDRLKSAAI
jgi:cobyrinic acid a,c-diamide synthase